MTGETPAGKAAPKTLPPSAGDGPTPPEIVKMWRDMRRMRDDLEALSNKLAAVAAAADAAAANAGNAGNVGGNAGGNGNGGGSPDGGNGVATDPQLANIVAEVMRKLKNPSSNTTTTTTATRAYSHPILDYVAASVLFATSYLSLDRRQRRGAAHAIPFIPVAVGALEAYTQAQRRENNNDAKLGLAAAGAGSLGALLIGAR
jgi:hypothetical protein